MCVWLLLEWKTNIPIPMILHPLRALPAQPLPKTYLEVRAGAENPPVARHDHALDLRVHVEHGVCRLDLAAHRVGEGIVLSGAV